MMQTAQAFPHALLALNIVRDCYSIFTFETTGAIRPYATEREKHGRND
jgi:hypothetical protein